jgi:hypothetical protein
MAEGRVIPPLAGYVKKPTARALISTINTTKLNTEIDKVLFVDYGK